MQAIVVRYHGATHARSAHYVAESSAGKLRVSASRVPSDDAGWFVAKAFAKKYLFGAPDCELLRGSLPNGDSVFVFDHPLSRED